MHQSYVGLAPSSSSMDPQPAEQAGNGSFSVENKDIFRIMEHGADWLVSAS
jgi:hypothetical protein